MSFFQKLFGSKSAEKQSDKAAKATNGSVQAVEELISSTLQGLIDTGHFDLEFSISHELQGENESLFIVELKGDDGEMIKDREGQTLEAIQLFVKRVVQHHFPDDRSEIQVDCNGFLQENTQQLVDLAEKLKNMALDKGKSVYVRALPAKDRKIVHQYLAEDGRVKSRSIGDGVFKKIKIYPIKGNEASELSSDAE